MRDVESLEIQHRIKINSSIDTALAWSPDDESVVYVDSGGGLHVVRLEDNEKIELPIDGRFDREGPLVWLDEATVIGWRWASTRVISIDLESLTVEDGNPDLIESYYRANFHSHATIEEAGDDVLLSNLDGSYHRPITEDKSRLSGRAALATRRADAGSAG